MTDRHTTVMILVPGQSAISFVVPRLKRAVLAFGLLLPLATGVVGQRYVQGAASGNGMGSVSQRVARASLAGVAGVTSAASEAVMARVAQVPQVSRMTHAVSTMSAALTGREPELRVFAGPPAPPSLTPALLTLEDKPEAATSTPNTSNVIDVKAMLRTLLGLKRGAEAEANSDVSRLPRTGPLRIEALHLNEAISVQPFAANGEPDRAALQQVDHLMRCRITNTEVAIDPRLVELLVRLHTLYGRPIQLVSGHRQPHTIGTKPTSQHALGRAADIRIQGVSPEELKRVALKLGARGVGLYPEKGFVHVDVRPKRYTWSYTAALGEQSDALAVKPVRTADVAARAERADHGEQEPEAEVGGEGEHEPDAPAQPTAAAEPEAL